MDDLSERSIFVCQSLLYGVRGREQGLPVVLHLLGLCENCDVKIYVALFRRSTKMQ